MFVPDKLFQPSLMFVGKSGAYPSEAPVGCSTLVSAPDLTHKHQTWVEKLARDKHSSLLLVFVNYDRKKFLAPGPNLMLFQFVTISQFKLC